MLSHIQQILPNNYFNIKQTDMIRKTSGYRASSPIRSPMRIPCRGVSPLRCSPFSRQAPLSPLKSRISNNASRTPTKCKSNNNNRVQFTKNTTNNVQNVDFLLMEKTLKSGIGLFQQLACQHKIGSQKKQNKGTAYNTTNPFQFSDKKKQNVNVYPKNSFAALIHNVKQIESIQASKGVYFTNQLSFKTIQKSKQTESNIKNQTASKIKNHEPLQIIQSFGKLNEISQKKQGVAIEKFSIKNIETKQQKSQIPENQPLLKKIPQSAPEPQSQKPKPIEITSSFEDVILLIRKASQKHKDESSVTEQEVKMSFQQNRISFNMNPFL